LASNGGLAEVSAQLVADEWAAIDLGQAALQVAALFCEDLHVAREQLELDALASGVGPSLVPARDDLARVHALVAALRKAGFAGRLEDFEDPRSSFLHEVLRRRSGLPITLALIYTEIGRRVGVPLFGIAFPGHFLVGFGAGPDAVIDAFSGKLLSLEACGQRLRELLGPNAQLTPELLAAASPRQILVRMLTNLKYLYAQRGEDPASLRACQAIFDLLPDDATNLRDRGLLLDRLGHGTAALHDLERFADLAPEDPSLASVRARIAVLRQQRTVLH